MACLFCGEDMKLKGRYCRQKLSSCSDAMKSLWMELVTDCLREKGDTNTTDLHLDEHLKDGIVCRNCLRSCKTFLKQKEQIKVKLNNSVLLINNINKIQDKTHQTRKRPQLEQGGPPRKRLFFSETTGSPAVARF